VSCSYRLRRELTSLLKYDSVIESKSGNNLENRFKPQKHITALLHPLGYRRSGNYWFKEADTHFYFLNLNSAYCGGDFYIDVGISLKQYIPDGDSFKNNWHIRNRINEHSALKGALCFYHESAKLTEADREVRLREGILNVALPVLNQLSTVAGLREYRTRKDKQHCLTTKFHDTEL
jgi:hypothetical protein